MTATDTDTTTEPDTESAGTKLMLLLKSVVFIFVSKKNLPAADHRREIL